MKKNDCLIEIGTEELPSRLLKTLSHAFENKIAAALIKEFFNFKKIQMFSTPRRMTLLIHELTYQQPDRQVEKRGPAVKAAYDTTGKPTQALLGFAKSCQTTVEKLEKLETAQGSWMIYRSIEKGKTIFELLPELVETVLKQLPIAKPMFWGNGEYSFVRPIHWITLIYGDKIIDGKIFGLQTDHKTYGHRFLHPEAIKIPSAKKYEEILKNKGFVIPSFEERREKIRNEILALAKKNYAKANIDDALLDEVTGLVEWPVALIADFDEKFLKLPEEVLTTCLQHHQKCFTLSDDQNHLLPKFITISNIKSKNPEEVIRGNQRVVQARLSDADFFYSIKDFKPFYDYFENLNKVVFQEKLGNLQEKSLRIANLAKIILVNENNQTITLAEKAGKYCKVDLLTHMVAEFPELQGVMGYYYAIRENEPKEVALAIREHYYPRFAKDAVPSSIIGCAIAIADRLDTLVGIFGINEKPTGEKDPFGLRRAALGIIRILVEKNLNYDIRALLENAAKQYKNPLPNKNVVSEVHQFMLERLRAWYEEKNVTPDTLSAVLAIAEKNNIFSDIDHRVHALQTFRHLPQAAALISANKRVSNILVKSEINLSNSIDIKLFQNDIENKLYAAVQKELSQLNSKSISNYEKYLIQLAALEKPVNDFFDAVMVMDENLEIRNNRLKLLSLLQKLFLEVADISVLQT